jgi:ubiquinone/menaquinone biosynthesis C-methylase UbiE
MHSQYDYRQTLERLVGAKTRWLDIGCGHTIFPEWMHDSIPAQKELLSRCELSAGCDPVDDRAHVAGLSKHLHSSGPLPFEDGSFNLVTANMVAEHVDDPIAFSLEVRRVLSDGGLFVIHTPNLYYFEVFAAHLLPNAIVRRIAHSLDGREDDDIFKTYYRMNTRKALKRLPGFKMVSLDSVETAPQFGKVPLLNGVESLLIRSLRWKPLRDFRADWIGVLEKTADSPHSV